MDAKHASSSSTPAAKSNSNNKNDQKQGKQGKQGKKVVKRMRYYSRKEVAMHNVEEDCWVSYFGEVYGLTPLLKEHKGKVSLVSLLFSVFVDRVLYGEIMK